MEYVNITSPPVCISHPLDCLACSILHFKPTIHSPDSYAFPALTRKSNSLCPPFSKRKTPRKTKSGFLPNVTNSHVILFLSANILHKTTMFPVWWGRMGGRGSRESRYRKAKRPQPWAEQVGRTPHRESRLQPQGRERDQSLPWPSSASPGQHPLQDCAWWNGLQHFLSLVPWAISCFLFH